MNDLARDSRSTKSTRAVVVLQAICILAVIIGATGSIPWTVAVVVIGLLAAVALVLCKQPKMAALAAAATIPACMLLHWPAVDIRATLPTDRVPSNHYFGVSPAQNATSEISLKNIAVATGTFTLGNWLTVSLYHVKAGKVYSVNEITIGRTSNSIGASRWNDMKFTLALGEHQTTLGRITQIGATGHSRGGGRGSEHVNDVRVEATQTLEGRVRRGTKRILHVEGNRGFVVDQTMSVEQFARRNAGNYLVVEVGFQ